MNGKKELIEAYLKGVQEYHEERTMGQDVHDLEIDLMDIDDKLRALGEDI